MSFFKRLAKVLVQLICISVAIYARPDKDSSLNNGIKEETSVDSADITRSNYSSSSEFKIFLVLLPIDTIIEILVLVLDIVLRLLHSSER